VIRVLRCADSGLLIELADLAGVHALCAAVADDRPAGVTDVVPAARTVLLLLDPERADPAAVERHVRGLRPSTHRRAPGPLVEVPVDYEGPDLPDVARLTGLTEREVVAAHTGRVWEVAFGGFAPGFSYLVGGDPRLEVPRRGEARISVPAGAVGLAGSFSGIYPRPSPGGWQLIGRTPVPLWRIDRDPPALLQPGMRVRFVDKAGT
jgi:KipI family sensor histidine kinase inhibitor